MIDPRVTSTIDAAIDRARPELGRLARAIHEKPELRFEEHEAARNITGYLERAGFNVERGLGGCRPRFERVPAKEEGRASPCSRSTTRCRRLVTRAATTSSRRAPWGRSWGLRLRRKRGRLCCSGRLPKRVGEARSS